MTGEEIREARKAQGLGQRHLAAASGVSQQAISRAETGREQLSEGAARKVAAVLKKS
jgi:transcriptional regulator with XRE-family HTH domain